RKDEKEKPQTYAQMGVSEYFQYDPTGDYLKPRLKGRRLGKQGYQILTSEPNEKGILVFPSEVLGLEMHLFADGRLRFFNPESGEYLRTPQESEQERLLERQRAEQERQRAERLAARLRELGIDPD
ncbi:MAG: Uma2 family endonuclease, partial [Symploca sp. SIO2C1]|nr:Uma2 family endonuclease [Symploca sp. SIO2C1]